MNLSDAVKRKARELGADLVGIAPASRFRNAPLRMSPLGLLPGCRSAVVMAIHHLDAAVELGGEPSPQDIGPYATQYTMNSKLDGMSFGLARFIEAQGFRALPIAASNIWRYHGETGASSFSPKKGTGTCEKGVRHLLPVGPEGACAQKVPDPLFQEPVPALPDFAPDLAHRYAAVAAGLGEIGWSNLALTSEFGPRQRFVTVLTDAVLEPTPMYAGPPLCDRCMACVKNCPTDAFRKEVRGMAAIEIGGRRFTFPATNKWRCSWGENFDLDLSLPIPDHIDEAVALAALEKHGMRGGEMGSCLRFCMTRARRCYDRSWSRAPRRRKTKVEKSPAKLLAGVLGLFRKSPVDVIAVGRASDFSGRKGDSPLKSFTGTVPFSPVHPKYHLPDVQSVISVAVAPPAGGEGDAALTGVLGRALDYAAFEIAHALDLAGYSAVTRTHIADNLVAQRLGVYRGGASFATILTSAKLPRTVRRKNARRARLSPRKVKDLCRAAGADLVGFFDVARFEEFRAGMERLEEKGTVPSTASRGQSPFLREAVVDRGMIYGPYVPQVRREGTRMLAPSDRLAGAKSVIVLGLHFPHAALDTAKVTPAGTTGPFAFVQYETLFQLRDMALRVAKALSSSGCRATFADDLTGLASQVKNSRGMIPDMRSSADAAFLAGLAHIGVHGYPITDAFGVRQRFIAIVTDLPLPSDPLATGKRPCERCDRPCVRACPTHALGDGKKRLRLEGRRFPLAAVDGFACDWAKRYGLSGPEGPEYWGVDSDRPLPKRRTAENVAAAVAAIHWGIQKRHINIAEECLRLCPARGK